MTKNLKEKLRRMKASGETEQLAVADCLEGIASNGGNMATNLFLVDCANEIIFAAQFFIREATKGRA